MSRPRPTDVDDDSAAARLRAAMVRGLRELGDIRDPRVAAAFSRVPRHLFAPGEPLEAAYALDRLVTRRDAHAIEVGCISAPQMQAMMLEQAGIERGMRCLEIGSGGYNAALMAELAGDEGEVTSVDIDPEVIDRTARCLAQAGYRRVNLVLADGEDGAPEHAPYDRVIVTAGAWDIPPAWIDQLADGGTITVPLRIRGLTRSLALEREDDHLIARSAKPCGFAPMHGVGAQAEHLLLLRNREIGLRFDDEWPGDAARLDRALGTPRAEAWSGVRIGLTKPFDLLELWLATVLDGFCLLSVDPDLDTGLVAPANRVACPATARPGGFAYLAVRRDHRTVEFGAHAFGPDAARLAEELAEQVRVWDRDHRGGPGPCISVHPRVAPAPDSYALPAPGRAAARHPAAASATGVAAPPERPAPPHARPAVRLPQHRIITRRHVHVAVAWPSPTRPGTSPRVFRDHVGH